MSAVHVAHVNEPNPELVGQALAVVLAWGLEHGIVPLPEGEAAVIEEEEPTAVLMLEEVLA